MRSELKQVELSRDSDIFSEAKRKKIFTSSTPVTNKHMPKNVELNEFESVNSSYLAPKSEDDIILLDSSSDTTSGVSVNGSSTSTQTEHGFEALNTDDSTDLDEDEMVSPYWSLSQNRVAIVTDQAKVGTNIIDNFFGCKAETVASVKIFPTSEPVQRRRSTAMWNTPPRYSMLPKY